MTYFLNIPLFSPLTEVLMVRGGYGLPPLLFEMSRAPSVAQLVRMLIRQHSLAGKFWLKWFEAVFPSSLACSVSGGVLFQYVTSLPPPPPIDRSTGVCVGGGRGEVIMI